MPAAWLHALSDFAVLAAEEQKRAAISHDDLFDLGDEDGVIAGILSSVQPAFQVGQRAMQNRRAVLGAFEARSSFFGSPVVRSHGARVVLRNCALAFGQDVHTETLLRVQVGVRAGALINADEHQHRVERYRGECIGGHAVNLVVRVQRNHGDAGRETTQRYSEICLTDAHARICEARLSPIRYHARD